MANQTAFRDAARYGDQALANYGVKVFLKSGETIYGGSLVFVDNVTGFAYASTGASRVCVGYNDTGVDLVATSDTSTSVAPRKNAFRLANSGTSALANKDRGKLCYAEDNQTARLASGSYAPLGTFIGVDPNDSSQVWVEVGSTPIASIAGYQATTTALTNLSALAGTGFLTQISGGADAGVFAERSMAVGSASLTITNPAGTAGNPTYDASAGLKAFDTLASTGIVCQTAGAANAGSFSTRSVTSTDSTVSITNPAGVAGNIDLSSLFAPIEVADPGTGAAIPVTRSATVMLTVGAGAETNTLAIPTFVGQELRLYCSTVGGGSRAITAASAINVAGNTVMTFNAARDNCTLIGVKIGGTRAWEIQHNASVALS